MALNPGSNQAIKPLSRIRAFIALILRGSMPISCSGAILDHSSKSLTASGVGGTTGSPTV